MKPVAKRQATAVRLVLRLKNFSKLSTFDIYTLEDSN